ncbi:MAG TPA: 5-oxoprolinase subunit PxpB [Bacilli bacterium]|nr:5-oxoprolinase subunit PxpB [Bacilli bacterium]
MRPYQLTPLGDTAVVVRLGERIDPDTQRQVRLLAQVLDTNPFPGLVEYTPTFTTVTVYYDPLHVRQTQVSTPLREKERMPYERVCRWLQERLEASEEMSLPDPRTVEIPVCYGGDFGPDLAYVAEHNRLSPQEVIDIHASGSYLVYLIGFAPGFPYLGGMSDRIAAPRKDTPRLQIPVGSVGIAGQQTGVYPLETPGGWQLIGRTPLPLFRPHDEQPSLLAEGDTVRFYPITRAEYDAWRQKEGSTR